MVFKSDRQRRFVMSKIGSRPVPEFQAISNLKLIKGKNGGTLDKAPLIVRTNIVFSKTRKKFKR